MDEVDLLDEPYDLYSIMHYQLDRSGLTLRSQVSLGDGSFDGSFDGTRDGCREAR